MAQSKFTIDLQDTEFPLLSEQLGRTLISAGTNPDTRHSGAPGVAYCHNVMPSKYGLDSIGYISEIPAITPATLLISDARVVYGSARSRLYLAWDSVGSVYALLTGATAWIALPATVPATGGVGFSVNDVTVGTVNGISYIWYSGIGCFQYNEGTNTLDSVILTGIAIPATLGVVASSGYLLAYTVNAIAWSSTIDPTDFVPSAVTGAGGGNVAGIGGDIIFCLSNTLGIVVYTATNSVAGTYTGNVKFPFKFREIDDSKGGISLDFVAYEANNAKQFVYSKAGLQAVDSRAAVVVLPEVTDFLAGKQFEDFDTVTEQFIETALTNTMLKKIKFIASRYLVISYGVTEFTHALIYDLSLNKAGKVKITHADCFEYTGTQTEVSKESIAFLLADGSVQLLDFSTEGSNEGVLILGKLQVTNTRMMTLLGAEVENVRSPDTLAVSSRVSLDGKTISSIVPGIAALSGQDIREYAWRNVGKNHSLQFIGKFNLTAIIVRYTNAGRR